MALKALARVGVGEDFAICFPATMLQGELRTLHCGIAMTSDRQRRRRRERLRSQYDRSRNYRRHEPPDEPGEEGAKPWWIYSLETALENPATLIFLAIAIAALWYWLFEG